MRQFIRHPAQVPIQVQRGSAASYASHCTENVSFGGLAFSSDVAIEPETFVTLRLSHLQPPFEVLSARVAWCHDEGGRYVVGVEFPDSEVAFRVRMVEQVCHIESYRRHVQQREGRQLTPEEAAGEWVSRYAVSFPDP